MGTGDFTHSAWRAQLEEKLEPDQDGFYVLKDEYRIRDASVGDHWKPRFVVTGEISSIYKKNDRVRKVHSLLILPGLEDAKKYPESWKILATFILTGGRSWGLTVKICWKLCWN